MKKHRTTSKNDYPVLAKEGGTQSIELPLPGLSALVNARQNVMDLCVTTGMAVIQEMMEADRVALCGAASQHDPDRTAYRGGSAPGEITLGGQRVPLRRPRARSVDDTELPLATYTWARDRDPLDETTWNLIAHGVSTRGYADLQDPLPEGKSGRSTSKSAVSRRFVALSQRKIGECLSRRLDDLDLWVVMIDGIGFADHMALVALGISQDGQKHVLGIREGSTENATVARALLRDLLNRGLPDDHPVLFVIDGGQGIRKAIKESFGEMAAVQRCQFHKIRNVAGHLPEELRDRITGAMKEAYHLTNAKLAKRRLNQLARSLEQKHPSAAESLREGLDETLTVQRLGIQGALFATLRGTNPIENLNGGIRKFTRNVRRWRDGSMVLRWLSSAVLEAESHFRRIRGYKQMSKLVAALLKTHPSSGLSTPRKVA
jgi:transposase-like protein